MANKRADWYEVACKACTVSLVEVFTVEIPKAHPHVKRYKGSS